MGCKSKVLSTVMAVVLAVGLCPAMAFADAGSSVRAGSLTAAGNGSSDDSVVASGTCGTCNWYIGDGLTIEPANGEEGVLDDWGDGVPPWWNVHYDGSWVASYSSVVVKGRVKAKTCHRMFHEGDVRNGLDLSGLDTSGVTSMRGMFDACRGLDDFDISVLDTSSVTDVSGMFWDSGLKSVDLSTLDTTKVIHMSRMFGADDYDDDEEDGGVDADDGWSLDALTLGPKTRLHDDCGLIDWAWKHEGDPAVYGTDELIARSGTAVGAGKWTRTSRIDLATASVSIASQGIVYDGAKKEPSVSASYAGAALRQGADYTVSYSNNVNAGTASVTLTGMGKFKGMATASFSIAPAPLGQAAVSGLRDAVYAGTPITQFPVVTLGGKALTAGADYALSYANNVDAGMAAVTVTGKGNYTGSVSAAFKIVKAANPMKVKGKKVKAKAKKVAKKAVKVKAGKVFKFKAKAAGKVTYKKVKKGSSKRLKVSKKGKLTVKAGTKAGTYKVKVKVKAAGDKNHEPLSKTVTVKVKVK